MHTRSRWTRRALLVPVVLGMVAVLGACQPDLWIRKTGSGKPYEGKGIINTTGQHQTVSRRQIIDAKALYQMRMKNITAEACSMIIKDGVIVNGGTYLRKYVYEGQNITAQVTGPNGYTIPNLASGARTRAISLSVKPTSGGAGNQLLVGLKAHCSSNANLADLVRGLTTIK
jgi:hypothetical protein